MIAPDHQIFDFLFGGVKGSSLQRAGELTGETENLRVNFTDILLGLTQGPQNEITSPSQKVLPVTDSVGWPVGRDLIAMDTFFDGEIPKRNAPYTMKVAFTDEHTMPVTDVERSLMMNKEPLPELKGESFPILNRKLQPQAPIVNTRANDMLDSLPLDMVQGKYEIMDSKVLVMSRGGGLTPLDLNSFGYAKTNLEDYFSELNLKEIEITTDHQQKPARLFTDPMPAIIAGQNVGQEVIIRSKLSKQVPKMRLEKSLGSSEAVEEDDGIIKHVTSNNQPAPTGNTSRALSGGAVVAQNPNRFEDAFRFESANISPEQNKASGKDDGIDLFSALERVNSDLKIVPDKIDVQPVRFTLPDNIKSALKPNGQAVTLRIEPEHLGPTRLSLVMHNDKLRARVIVENYQAKAAVEASLDRLVNQLSKANIEVDRVEVFVDGEAARNSLFERPPQWRHRTPTLGGSNHNGALDLNDELTSESTTSGQTSYVGAGGVNLLV